MIYVLVTVRLGRTHPKDFLFHDFDGHFLAGQDVSAKFDLRETTCRGIEADLPVVSKDISLSFYIATLWRNVT